MKRVLVGSSASNSPVQPPIFRSMYTGSAFRRSYIMDNCISLQPNRGESASHS